MLRVYTQKPISINLFSRAPALVQTNLKPVKNNRIRMLYLFCRVLSSQGTYAIRSRRLVGSVFVWGFVESHCSFIICSPIKNEITAITGDNTRRLYYSIDAIILLHSNILYCPLSKRIRISRRSARRVFDHYD